MKEKLFKKDKSIFLENNKQSDEFIKAIDSEIVREKHPLTIRCNDGHWVRSPYEKAVDDELFSKGLSHSYEKVIFDIDGTSITPDFYLPKYNLYAEVWGYKEKEKKDYDDKREYKEEFYKNNPKYRLFSIEKEDVDKRLELIIEKLIFDEDKNKKD